MNIASVSRFTGIPSTTLKRWIAAGVIPKTEDMSTIVKAIILHKDKEILDSKKNYGNVDLEAELLQEKIRLTKAQAAREEIKNAVSLNNLLPTEEVERTWKTVCLFISSRLQSIPKSMSSRLLDKDVDDMELILAEEISDALKELSNGNF